MMNELSQPSVSELYRQMILIRRFEEECSKTYMDGKISGFLHLYIGEEAIAVGSISTLGPEDYIITHYRDHGHALARGMDPKIVMAELMGKASGSSGGKGGSMHLFDVSKRFMGGHAIVGGQLPLATGLALAIKHQGGQNIVLCFFGDGAVNEGAFHESMNLASLWELPVLFLLENNLYGMGSHVDRTRSGGKDIYTVAESYKIPAAQVDGMDVFAVKECTTEAIEQIRAGNGPIFVEAMTYRFRGHSMADPSSYRESSEVDRWKEKDPITVFKKEALAQNLITDTDIVNINQEVETQLLEAIQFAEDSANPELDSLYDNVYA